MPDTPPDRTLGNEQVLADAELIRKEANLAEAKIINTAEPKKLQDKPNKYFTLAMSINGGKECKEFLYCLEEDKFYNYKNGYWTPLYDIEFLGILENRMPRLISMTLPSRKQIIENFKTIARQHVDRFNWCEMVNLENGMLNLSLGQLEEHEPMFFSTNRLPYKYDAGAKCELWLKSLSEIFEGDQIKIDVLQEFFGYCLTKDTKQHKALLLLGESRSAKSTLLYVLRYLIGDINCSSVPLKDIRNPQHTPDLVNKLVNFDYDVSAKATEFEDEFKKITSGEPIRANQKYIESFSFNPYCKLAMAANIFPKITDHSSAFYNRLILIPCDRVFSPEEQNRDLPKQLLGELPGILNWAMAGLKRLTNRGRFAELEFMREAVEELENENNPVNLFFDEYVVVENGTWIEKSDLFDKYKMWCERTKNFTLSKNRFASCVYKKYHKHTPKQIRLSSGKRAWIWKNLKYIDVPQGQGGQEVGWQE